MGSKSSYSRFEIIMQQITRVLVLEGIEGSGKTTLAQNLVNLGWGYVHFAYETYDNLIGYWTDSIEEAAYKSANGRVVVDRMHLSCRAYGRALRAREDISEADWWVLEGWLWNRGGSVVFVPVRDENLTANRLDDRFRELISIDDLSQYFSMAMNDVTLPVTTLNPGETGMDTAAMLDRLHPPLVPVQDEGMGTREPIAWLVGDRRNSNAEHRIRSGCFDGGNNSGDYLRRALQIAGYTWPDIHISNAYDADGTPRLVQGKVAELGYPSVVTLGNNASRLLEDMQLGYWPVKHPQYARRFKHNDLLHYAWELRNAIEGRI